MGYIEEYNTLIQGGDIPACKRLLRVYEHLVNNMIPGSKAPSNKTNYIAKSINIFKTHKNPIKSSKNEHIMVYLTYRQTKAGMPNVVQKK